MRSGRSAGETLQALVSADGDAAVRQVAMVDANGGVAAHTGDRSIHAAGHYVGEGFTTQANMMANPTVWGAMARAYSEASGDLAERMLIALEAAEAEGGDIRGRQSAALLVVAAESTGQPWIDRCFDLRVEDHPDPVAELRRLVRLRRVYQKLDEADGLVTAGDFEAALGAYEAATGLVEDRATNGEAPFWVGVTLAAKGREAEAAPFLHRAYAVDAAWAELIPRLPAAKLLPSDELADRLARLMREGVR
jgi:uncharacterized Ntn-hydrolase superfamily protein